MRLRDLSARYLEALAAARGASSNTVDGYRRDLDALTRAMEAKGIDNADAITPELLRAYLGELSARGRAASSQRRAVSSIRQLFLFAQREHLGGPSPAKRLEAPPVFRQQPRVPSVDEAEQLLAALAQDRSPKGLRDRCALELIYGCGLRASELCALSVDCIDAAAKKIVLVERDGSRRPLPVGEAAAGALDDYLARARGILLAGRRHDALLVANSGQPMSRVVLFAMVKKRAQAAGLAGNVSPHTFRHAFAAHLLDNGADLLAVQRMLGHKSVTTTERYHHAGPSALHDTLKAHHPLGGGAAETPPEVA